MKPATSVLVVAAGSGQRLGADIPKQYRMLAGKPMLRYCVETFLAHPAIDKVLVAIHPDFTERYLHAVADLGARLLPPVTGGPTRQESVRLGLERLGGIGPDLVLIHDAARPLIDAAIIERALAALSSSEGVLVAVPVNDTIKRAPDALVGETLDRSELWRAQTPQGFRFAAILAAHRRFAGAGMTDDAAVAEAAGMKVALALGSERNFKVTTSEDMVLAEAYLSEAMEFRTGNGFDVHRLVPGDGMILCGVPIPGTLSLQGHSDADVALHALTDAILGAIGAGDIGAHFPPSDPKWRGAESWKFLDHAARLVRDRQGRVVHCDITIICERPKIGPHRSRMVERVAEILGIEAERVSVKATTTEELGFTGRGEGIAAQATATVAMKGK